MSLRSGSSRSIHQQKRSPSNIGTPRGGAANSSSGATFNTGASVKEFPPFSVGGYPRAQSLAGDYAAAANQSLMNNTTATGAHTNNALGAGGNTTVIGGGAADGSNQNNANKLHHLLRFVNHKPEGNKFDGPAENFFTGSKLVRELTGVSAKCMACVGNTVWIGEKSGVLSVWDLQTGDLIKRKEAQRNRTFVTAIAGVGLYVWVGYSDGLVRIYDPATIQLLKETKEHSGAITQLMLSYNGLSVYSASADFTIVQWDANSVERVAVLSGHKGGVKCMATAVGLRLFSGGDDGQIIEWDVVRARPRHIISGHHRGSVRALTATAGHLWSGGEDGSVRLWSLTNETGNGNYNNNNNNNANATMSSPPLLMGGANHSVTTNGTTHTVSPTPTSTLRIPTQQTFGNATNNKNHQQTSNLVFNSSPATVDNGNSPNDAEEEDMAGHHNDVDGVDGGSFGHDASSYGLADVATGTNDQLLAAAPVCVHVITNPHTSAVTSLIVVGSYVWSASGSRLYMWNAESFTLEGAFNQRDGSGGTDPDDAATAIATPSSPSSAAAGGFITCLSAVHQSVIARLWTCGSEGTVKMWNAESKWSSAFKAAQDEHVQRMELLLNANADREQQLEAGYEAMEKATNRLKASHDEMAERLLAAEGENETLRAELEEALNANADNSEELHDLRREIKKLRRRLPQNKFERNLRSLLRGVCQSHQDVCGPEEIETDGDDDDGYDGAYNGNSRRNSSRRRGSSSANGDDDDDLDSVSNYRRRHAKSAPLVETQKNKKQRKMAATAGASSANASFSKQQTAVPSSGNNNNVGGDDDDEDEVEFYMCDDDASNAAAAQQQQKQQQQSAANGADGNGSDESDDDEDEDEDENSHYSRLLKPRFAGFDVVACAKLQQALEELRQLHTDPFKGEDEVAFRWRNGDYRFGDPKEFAGDDENKDDDANANQQQQQQQKASDANGNNSGNNNKANNGKASVTIAAGAGADSSSRRPLTATHSLEAQQNLVRLEMLALRIQVSQLNKQTNKASLDLKDLAKADAETLRRRRDGLDAEDLNGLHPHGNNNAAGNLERSDSTAVSASTQAAAHHGRGATPPAAAVSAGSGSNSQNHTPPLTPRRRAAAAVLAAISGEPSGASASVGAIDDNDELNGDRTPPHNSPNSFANASGHSPGGASARAPAAPPEGVALIDIDDIDEEDLRILMNIKKRALLASADEAKVAKQRRAAKKREARKLKAKAKKEKQRARQQKALNRYGGNDDDDEEAYGSDDDDDQSNLSSILNGGGSSSDDSDDDDDGLLGASTTLQLVMQKYNYDPSQKSAKHLALQALLQLSDEDMAALYMGPIPCPKTLNDDDKATLALIRLKYGALSGGSGPSSSPNAMAASSGGDLLASETVNRRRTTTGGTSSSTADAMCFSAPIAQLIAVRLGSEADAPVSGAVLGYLTAAELRSEELEALRKIAKKNSSNNAAGASSSSTRYQQQGASSASSFNARYRKQQDGEDGEDNEEQQAVPSLPPATRRVRNLEAIVLRHIPIAVTLPPLATLPRRDLAVVHNIYKKYRSSVVDLKPEDPVLVKADEATASSSSPLRAGVLEGRNGNANSLLGGSFLGGYGNNDDDARSTVSRRSGGGATSRSGGRRAPKLYDPSSDYPSLPTGLPSALLRLRADVETSLATVLQQQTRTRNELSAMALELAEARELLCENDELRQLLQEGEDKDEMRRARKEQKKAEKAQKKAAKAARKATRLISRTRFGGENADDGDEEAALKDTTAHNNDDVEEDNARSPLPRGEGTAVAASSRPMKPAAASAGPKMSITSRKPSNAGAPNANATAAAASRPTTAPAPRSGAPMANTSSGLSVPVSPSSARSSAPATPRRTNSSAAGGRNGTPPPRAGAAGGASPNRSRAHTPVAPARASDLRK